MVSAELQIQRADAPVWAPAAFRKHGVYLSARDLDAAWPVTLTRRLCRTGSDRGSQARRGRSRTALVVAARAGKHLRLRKDDPRKRRVFDYPGLRVSAASPAHIAADHPPPRHLIAVGAEPT
jgi:hypothetical protein